MRYAWIVGVAACGNGSGGIAVHAERASLVLAQDGDGAWQSVALDAMGNGRFESSAGFYGVARFCPGLEFSTGSTIRPGGAVRLGTQPEGVELPCPSVATSIRLTGTTSPNAEIFVDLFQGFADEAGAYDMTVTPGRHDVIVVSHDPAERILVERDVEMLEDRSLDLPIATAGIAVIPITPTVTNGGPDVSLQSDINTRGETWAMIDSDPTTIHVPPGETLVIGDRATVSAFGRGCTVQQQLASTPPTFTLPVPMNTRIDRGSARWFADPSIDWEFVQLSFSQSGERMSVTAEMAWLEARGSTSTPSLPGIDPAVDFPGWLPELGSNFVDGAATAAHLGISRGQFDGELVACGADVDFSW